MEPGKPIKVAIVEHNPIMMECLHTLLLYWHFEIIFEVNDCMDMDDKYPRLPDICILGLDSPLESTHALISLIHQKLPTAKILLYSMNMHPSINYAAIFGADAHLSKMASYVDFKKTLFEMA